MKFKSLVSLLAIGILGMSSVALAADSDFITKVKLIQSIFLNQYTGPGQVDLTITKQDINNNALPLANVIIERNKAAKGSYIKDVGLNSDGTIKLTGFIGQGIKSAIKIPFFSNFYIWAKPSVIDGDAKVEITKIKLGFIPISVNYVKKFAAKWVDLDKLDIRIPGFYFDKITVSENGIRIEGKYLKPVAEGMYYCNGKKTIFARFYEGEKPKTTPGQIPSTNGRVIMKLSDGRVFTLPKTISADGMRYANKNESIIFWSKGDGVFVMESNTTTYSGCKVKL